MGVLIGIDFGKKRTGLAHTDPDHIIASGLTTLATDRAIDFLQDYHKSTPVEKFVVGQPKQKDGNFSDVEKDILIFQNKFYLVQYLYLSNFFFSQKNSSRRRFFKNEERRER